MWTQQKVNHHVSGLAWAGVVGSLLPPPRWDRPPLTIAADVDYIPLTGDFDFQELLAQVASAKGLAWDVGTWHFCKLLLTAVVVCAALYFCCCCCCSSACAVITGGAGGLGRDKPHVGKGRGSLVVYSRPLYDRVARHVK
jgi:hypothetical protein